MPQTQTPSSSKTNPVTASLMDPTVQAALTEVVRKAVLRALWRVVWILVLVSTFLVLLLAFFRH